MRLFKKTVEILFYIFMTMVLVFSLYTDRAAYKAQQEHIQNSTGYPPAVGQISPEFFVSSVGEERIHSSELYGDGNTIIIFSFPSCPVLNDELSVLRQTDIPHDKISVVFFAGTENEQGIINMYIAEYSEFNFYTEIEHSVQWSYKLHVSPTLYVYYKDGSILYRLTGSIGDDNQQIEEITNEVLYKPL